MRPRNAFLALRSGRATLSTVCVGLYRDTADAQVGCLNVLVMMVKNTRMSSALNMLGELAESEMGCRWFVVVEEESFGYLN